MSGLTFGKLDTSAAISVARASGSARIQLGFSDSTGELWCGDQRPASMCTDRIKMTEAGSYPNIGGPAALSLQHDLPKAAKYAAKPKDCPTNHAIISIRCGRIGGFGYSDGCPSLSGSQTRVCSLQVSLQAAAWELQPAWP